MTARWLFALIGTLAVLAGAALWSVMRIPERTALSEAEISPSALFAATFTDEEGRPASLARFPHKLLVVNFWATWCGPCREEMPAFDRLQAAWGPRGVQFVGLSAERPEVVKAFASTMALRYPLWTGGEGVSSLARRLGNHLGVLPFTAILDADGTVVERKVGTYNDGALAARLGAITSKMR
jgi:thiol-disulfide isomerase/thioredoxin